MTDVSNAARVTSVLEDPSVQSVARVYAVALLDSVPAAEAGQLVEEAESFVSAVLDTQPQFERLLCTVATQQKQKLELVERIVAARATPVFTNFLRVLIRHDRAELIRTVVAMAQRELEVRQGKVRVRVTSAAPLTAASTAALVESLSRSLAAEPILETQVDPALLGGVVIRVGDTVYDGSVRIRLKQLRARLRERCLNEVQRGRDRFRYPEGN